MKRYLAIFLILLAIGAVIFAIVFVLLPLWRTANPPAQPPPINSQALQPEVPETPAPAIAKVAPPAPVDQGELALAESAKRFALDFVTRAQTGSNYDNFEAMRQGSADASTAVRAFLETERTALQQAHPRTAGTWARTVRGLAARITNAPVKGNAQVLLTVEAHVTTEENNLATPVDIARYEVTLAPVGAGWQVTRLERME